MFSLPVPTTQGTYMENVYNIDDFPYQEKLFALPKVRTKGKSKHKRTYYNISAAFDIESTTIEPAYTIGKDGKKNYLSNPYAYMYQWQFCICDTVIFGRRWEEFLLLLDKLAEHLNLQGDTYLVVYVHMLAYEFQFLKDFIHIKSLFCKDKHKPLKLVTSHNIEFRCSYFLSNMSLAMFCKNSALCTHYKLEDTYNYRILRTPDTPYGSEDFSWNDLAYCYNDVRGLCECIDSKLWEDIDHTKAIDTIATIPLTSTGYVRRDFRRAMQSNPYNRAWLLATRLTPEQYELLRKMFRGGNTHANRFFTGQIVENVTSKDKQSSYPASMELDLYPVTRFKKLYHITQDKLDRMVETKACIIECTLYGVRVHDDVAIPYIDIAHCENLVLYKDKDGNPLPYNDNGRLLRAKSCKIVICEIDLNIIRRTYEYDIEIHTFYYADKGKLPIEYRERLLYWYEKKTALKDVEGQYYEYAKSKNNVNASFGMSVTDIAHSTVNYDSDTMKWSEIKPSIAEALDIFYDSWASFIPYQIGCWITANARNELQTAIDETGIDCVYVDTDSTKYINAEKHEAFFDNRNAELIAKCEASVPPAYAVKNGKKYYLGIWDDEGTYHKFKTLGAKKYCYVDSEGELHTTVSGMSKAKGAKAVGSIENFTIGKTFFDIGRTVSWYNDTGVETITVRGSTFTTASNIGVLDTTYTLGVSKDYWEVLAELLNEEERVEFLSNLY